MDTFAYNDDEDDLDTCFNSQDTFGTICDVCTLKLQESKEALLGMKKMLQKSMQ